MSAQPGLVHDGMYRVSFVDTIVDPNAPTTTELDDENAIGLQCQVTPDGLKREAKDDSVDTSRLCSVFTTQRVGRTTFDVELTLVRLDESQMTDPAKDAAYHTLVKGKTGYLVIRDNVKAETEWAADDEVEVYHVECGSQNKATPAANEQMTFTVSMMVLDDPSLDAKVVAP